MVDTLYIAQNSTNAFGYVQAFNSPAPPTSMKILVRILNNAFLLANFFYTQTLECWMFVFVPEIQKGADSTPHDPKVIEVIHFLVIFTANSQADASSSKLYLPCNCQLAMTE